MSGQSGGFGFVEMSSQTESEAAIEALNGTEPEGRTLSVNETRPHRSGGEVFLGKSPVGFKEASG